MKLSLSVIVVVSLLGCGKQTGNAPADSLASTTTVKSPPAPAAAAGTQGTVAMYFDSSKVSIASLPQQVRQFVTERYPGYKIASAAFDPLCGGAPAVDVGIRKKGATPYSLIFKPDGSFVQKEEDVAIKVAPQAILDSLKRRFKGYRIAQQIERLTLVDGHVEYSFDLVKSHVQREVILSDRGVVVCDTKK